jgi:hypothetical protein
MHSLFTKLDLLTDAMQFSVAFFNKVAPTYIAFLTINCIVFTKSRRKRKLYPDVIESVIS